MHGQRVPDWRSPAVLSGAMPPLGSGLMGAHLAAVLLGDAVLVSR